MTLHAALDSPAAALNTTAAIRERCRNVLAAVDSGRARHFSIDRSRLPAAAELVAQVTRRRYRTLDIPYHSRWRHFEAGGIDRIAELDRALAGRDRSGSARAKIDLAVVSVLLDAGAGAAWGYVERESDARYTRSEGLAIASYRAFMAGAFSARRDDPLRVDARALQQIDATTLARVMQVGDGNPIVGLEGRASLLRRLGGALIAHDDVFADLDRPGGLFDTLTRADPSALTASTLLHALLEGLNSIWLTGSVLDGTPLGDAWRHPDAGGRGVTAGWVPFHKLSQWLAYSLLEPFEWAGAPVGDRDALTGLPEYRNGGLLLDAGVLQLTNDADATRSHAVGSELVVEWRALTVALLDELAPLVRARLVRPGLPLACILEGGTWAAGRELAQAKRGGDPPITIQSDGTVF